MPLDQYQLKAVKDFAKNPTSLAVKAVAGSGKSTTLIAATQTLKFKKNPNSIVVVFTNAAKETLLKKSPDLKGKIKTTYQLGYKALRDSFDTLEWDVNSIKYETIIREIIDTDKANPFIIKYGLNETFIRNFNFIKEVKTLVNLIRVNMLTLKDNEEILDLAYNLCLPVKLIPFTVFLAKEAIKIGFRKCQTGEIDITDMIWFPLAAEERGLDIIWQEYQIMLIDEAQDLSNAQRRISMSSCAPNAQLMVVGDPRQAIFFFAGSNPESFALLAEDINADLLNLPICYRCPDTVLNYVREWVPNIEGTGKEGIFEYMEKQDAIAKLIQEREGMVLARTNYSLLKIGINLMDLGIKVTFSREKYKKVFKGLLSVFRDDIQDFKFLKSSLEEEYHIATREKNGFRADVLLCLLLILEKSQVKNWFNLNKYIDSLFCNPSAPLILSTIHSSKGDEHDKIYIWDYDKLVVTEDMSNNEVIQTTNLRIVALTRTKRELYLV